MHVSLWDRLISIARQSKKHTVTSRRRRNNQYAGLVQHLESRVLLSAGDLDPTFSNDGITKVNVTGHNDYAYGVAIQNDGKIVAVGVGETNGFFAMARLHSDGTLDTSFGPNGTGKVQTRFGTGVQRAQGVAIQPDQRIVVVGQAGGPNGDFGVARYLTNGSLDLSFIPDYSSVLVPCRVWQVAGWFCCWNCGIVRAAHNPPTPEAEFGDRMRQVVIASMRHEARDGHCGAAQVGHIRPTCRQENSDAPSTHDNPRGNFRHQHAPRPWMCFTESVASMSLIVATTSCVVAVIVETRVDACVRGRIIDIEFA